MTVSFSLELLNAPAVVAQIDDMPDVLVEVQYRLCGFNGTSYAYRSGTASFTAPDPAAFIAYDALTADLVKSWVQTEAADDIAAFEADIETELATPQPTLKPLPWQSPKLSIMKEQLPA
jgi:hypothetical protein